MRRKPAFDFTTYTVNMDSLGLWPKSMEVTYRWIDDSDPDGAIYYIEIDRIVIDGLLMNDWVNDDCYDQIVEDLEAFWEEVSNDE
jgi:hypothetical protein